jgi:uncharacterized protein Yka (UPF0111/DUF47 family)
MTSKQNIIVELGQVELLLPDRIAQALTSNDQAKYYLALLQAARASAENPRVAPTDLKVERLASGASDKWLDDIVAATRKDGTAYAVPNLGEILNRLMVCVNAMIACLDDSERQVLGARLAKLAPNIKASKISGAEIDNMTSGDRKAGDSLHLLVMDAHRAINALQARTATELLDGAHVHGLTARSRPLVAAFMKGINRTAPLKFSHPGLGTTATEHNGRLLIQNDIGTTDAHVLIVRVTERTATLTYTDIHRPRLEFFQSLFSKLAVDWSGTDVRSSGTSETGSYLLSTGTYRASSQRDLEAYLEHLGSRIVFLIDWNHMRKRLRAFVDKKQAIEVLKWAADNDYGHRGLIELGGEKALASAIEYAAGRMLHYGDRLDQLVGEPEAATILREAMRLATTGLLTRRSRRAVLDEIKARLKRQFENADLSVFELASRHAAYGYDIAVGLRKAFDRNGRDLEDWPSRLSERAVQWEAQADQVLNEARDDMRRLDQPKSLLSFLNHADDAVDALEEAASLFALTCLVDLDGKVVGELRGLSDLALRSCQELVKCIECAATITRSDVRDDFDDFLAALERLIALEHEADGQTRRLRRLALVEGDNCRAMYLTGQISSALEAATDAYTHAGQTLRQYLMEEVIA